MGNWLWIILMAVSAAVAAAPPMRHAFAAAGRLFDRLAKRPAYAALAVGAVAFGLSAGTSVLGVVPEPAVHDEFAYLLAGETFASGRLANPAHPMWQHFETMHVLQQPAYASKFPPAQGLVLALGSVLLGDPIAGVWLSTAAACAAVCWMLLAWVPGRWAVAGGLLAAFHPMVLTWSQGYWGGAVAMGAGALLLGAVRRLIDEPGAMPAIILAVALAILANSRPYEGLLLAMPAMVGLGYYLLRRRTPMRLLAGRVVMPVLAILVVSAGAMAYINWRITGRPAVPSYALHDRTYCRTPHFVWQPLRQAPEYRHAELAQFHDGWEPGHWLAQQSLGGWAGESAKKLRYLGADLLHPLTLAIPLLGLPLALGRDRRLMLAGALVLAFVLGLLPLTWSMQGCSHRAAPMVPAVLLLLTAGLWQLGQVRWGGALVRIVLVTLVLATAHTALGLYIHHVTGWHRERARLVEQLELTPGEHLVIVRYLPGHDVLQEWVFNSADIDRSRIVWAREMGPEPDRQLLGYFRGRKAWLLEIGPEALRFDAYSPR
jgi:hypothetical protein